MNRLELREDSGGCGTRTGFPIFIFRLPADFFPAKLRVVTGDESIGLRGPAEVLAWRQSTRTSQRQLAEAIGLKHASSIYLYEAGRQPLTYPHLVSLQRVTGISIWTLAWPGQRLLMREIAATPPEAPAQKDAR